MEIINTYTKCNLKIKKLLFNICYKKAIFPLKNTLYTYSRKYYGEIMVFGSFFSPITYNNPYVNSIVTNFNLGGLIPNYPFYNFGLPANNNSIFSGSNFGLFGNNINNIWFGGAGIGPIYNFTGSKSAVKIDESLKKSEEVTSPIEQTKPDLAKGLKKSFTSNALKYLGYNEKDGSSRKFSNSGEWCADFVTYVVKESYKEKGLKAPDWFGHHRTEILRQQAKDNDKYLCITDKSDRAKTITENVKVGDIVIWRENNASHTGFVSKIYKDGSFDTVEGNRGDKVAQGHYKANDSNLSGFVQLG